jgi:hypothetical protein
MVCEHLMRERLAQERQESSRFFDDEDRSLRTDTGFTRGSCAEARRFVRRQFANGGSARLKLCEYDC